MVIVLDENVSLALTAALRQVGHKVIAVAETAERGMADTEVWELAKAERAVLITRDHGFTNPVRFRTQEVGAVIYLRRGNLSSEEEVALVTDFWLLTNSMNIRGVWLPYGPAGRASAADQE